MLNFNSEKYDGNGFLRANFGKWVNGQIKFFNRFAAISSQSNPFQLNTTGTVHWISRSQGNFTEDGFNAGDSINVHWTENNGTEVNYTRTIDYVDCGNMYLTASIPYSSSSQIFPTQDSVGFMDIIADKVPETIQFDFNLTQNGISSLASVIDGELNRFEALGVNTIGIGGSVGLVQMGNHSGGYVKDVVLTYEGDANNGWKDFTIDFKFIQWGFKDSNYETVDCLAPISQITAFAEHGNYNCVVTEKSGNIQGDTGLFNEKFNGGVNPYSVSNLQFTNTQGDDIDALDYSATSSFSAQISNVTSADYRIGLVWLPIDEDIYSNLSTSFADNLILNVPDNTFNSSPTADPTIYNGFQNSDGAKWDFQNLKFELQGSTLLVSGDVIPNGDASNMFSNISDGGRRSVLWVLIDGVNVVLFDADNIDAPIKGVQIPYIKSEETRDISDANVYGITTTEAAVLYELDFNLVQGIDYNSVKCGIEVYNQTQDVGFFLERFNFNFASIPFVGGIKSNNFTQNRPFNLPPDSNRNLITLFRKENADLNNTYGYRLSYGFLNRWEYWLEQINANQEFYDYAAENYGLNKDWKHYINSEWQIRIVVNTEVEGVEDYNHRILNIRPYNDENVTTVINFTDEDGNSCTTPIYGQTMDCETVLTWDNNYSDEWGEVTVEDFESGNRWVIDSINLHGGIVNNPLKPILGADKLDLTVLNNIATMKYRLNTENVSDKISLTHRIFSTPKFDGGSLSYNKQTNLSGIITTHSGGDFTFDFGDGTIQNYASGEQINYAYGTNATGSVEIVSPLGLVDIKTIDFDIEAFNFNIQDLMQFPLLEGYSFIGGNTIVGAIQNTGATVQRIEVGGSNQINGTLNLPISVVDVKITGYNNIDDYVGGHQWNDNMERVYIDQFGNGFDTSEMNALICDLANVMNWSGASEVWLEGINGVVTDVNCLNDLESAVVSVTVNELVPISLSTASTTSTEIRLFTYSGGTYFIDWENDGNWIEYGNAVTASKTYSSAYVGNIRIACFNGINDFNNLITALNNFNFDVLDLPQSLDAVTIRGTNICTGYFSDFNDNVTSIRWQGQNVLTGAMSDFNDWITFLYFTGQTVFTGDLADTPSSCTYLFIISPSTMSYTAGHTFNNRLGYFYYAPTSVGLTSTEMDNLLEDLSTSITIPSGGKQIILTGANAPRTSASDPFVTDLINIGYTVTTNP